MGDAYDQSSCFKTLEVMVISLVPYIATPVLKPVRMIFKEFRGNALIIVNRRE